VSPRAIFNLLASRFKNVSQRNSGGKAVRQKQASRCKKGIFIARYRLSLRLSRPYEHERAQLTTRPACNSLPVRKATAGCFAKKEFDTNSDSRYGRIAGRRGRLVVSECPSSADLLGRIVKIVNALEFTIH
jgi:hypothetical protein